MDWKKQEVLVTGAGGFIGSHLVEHLLDLGASVHAFIHYNSRNDWGNLELIPDEKTKELEIITGDVTDPFSIGKAVAKTSVVFHLASLIAIPYSYTAPASYVKTNVEGTLNVMQACLECGVEKVVHTSTSEVYGTAQYVPIDEKHPLQGQSPYSASKIGADKIAESYYLSFDLPVATARPFNTYGPRQSARAIIPSVACQVLAGQDVRLGSLSPVRDLTYVLDTVKGFTAVAACADTAGQVLNIGSGKGISIGDLADKIIAATGKESGIIRDPARTRPDKSEVMRLICDNSLMKKTTGWEPRHTLTMGIEETVKWISDNLYLYKTGIYNV